MTGRGIVFAVAVAVALCVSVTSHAHLMAPAVLEVSELGDGRAMVEWRQTGQRFRGVDLGPRLPDRCRPATDVAVPAVAGGEVRRWLVDCAGGLAGARIGVDDLDGSPIPVLIVLRLADGATVRRILHAGAPDIVVPARARPVEVLYDYARLGVGHILGGLDHLLFVAALLLLVRGWRVLVWTITAFTVGHSMSLAAATLGWVGVPQPPVEAAIALSIVFVSIEVLRLGRGQIGFAARWPWLASFGFGLLHGLGFASALAEAGLPSGAVPLALLSFNLGVEIGQLGFVAVVVVLARGFRSVLGRAPRWGVAAASYAIGGIATIWFVDRTSGFLALHG